MTCFLFRGRVFGAVAAPAPAPSPTPTPTPTPTPGVSWPAGVTAPSLPPATSGAYGSTGATPLSDPAAIRAAVAAAGNLQTVYVTGAMDVLDLSNIDKGLGNLVFVRSFDPNNKAYVHPAQASAGTNGAIKLNNSRGIAFQDIKAAITDCAQNYTPIVVGQSANTIWFQRCDIGGSAQSDSSQWGKGFITNGFGATNLHFLDTAFHNLLQGIATINATGIEAAFNSFDLHSGDPMHFDATGGVSAIGNTGTNFRDKTLEHADLIQFATSAASGQGCSNNVVFMNGALGDPTQALNDNSTKSLGRMQGITVQDDYYNQTGTSQTFANFLILKNFIAAAEYASFQINFVAPGKWSNIKVEDNDFLYLAGSDGISETRLAINDAGLIAGGDVLLNRSHKILTSAATGLTGQIGTFTDTAQVLADFAAAQSRYNAYLATRAQYRALFG